MFQSLRLGAAAALAAAVIGLFSGCTAPAPAETTAVTQSVQEQTGTTFRNSFREVPRNWSPMEWFNDAERFILSATGAGLYAHGAQTHSLIPALAASAPVDVTGQYAGKDPYGVPADAASGYAYQIDLRPDACWDDGTPINADTWTASMELMLSSQDKYLRAPSFYSEQLRLANAYAFHMQDQADALVCRSLADSGYASAAEAQNDGHSLLYLDMDGFWGLDCGWQNIGSEVSFRDEAVPEGQPESFVSPKYLYETYLADGAPYASYQATFLGIADQEIRQTDFSQVGFFKTGEYQLTLVLAQPLAPEILQSCLTLPLLVRTDLWQADPLSYAVSAETTPSCGPMRLVRCDREGFRLERNEHWFGPADSIPDAVEARIIPDEAAALDAFRAGQLDSLTLTGYQEGALLTPETYVSKLSLNTSMVMLNQRQRPGVNKNILTFPDFRQAISRSIDREAFVRACVPAHSPALGLVGDAFISDFPTHYRDTEQGRQVLDRVYGDSAYDPEAARALFQSAWDQALEAGCIRPDDVVELEFLVYGDEDVYTLITRFLQDALNSAAEGTDLEGKIRIVETVDENYYETARRGEFEIILSTWGGSATDPYGLMGCYCTEESLFEFGFDPSHSTCTIELDGTPVTKTFRGWYESLVSGKYASADTAVRNQILAGLEENLLSRFNCIPLYERNRITLDSDRVVRLPRSDLANPLDIRGIQIADPDL